MRKTSRDERRQEATEAQVRVFAGAGHEPQGGAIVRRIEPTVSQETIQKQRLAAKDMTAFLLRPA